MTKTWARLRHWVADPDGVRDESSNSFAVFVLLLPVIIGCFGIGVDISRDVYLRVSLQNDLDLGVVAGAAAGANTANTVINLTPSAATVYDTVERIYAMNRAVGPGLRCTGTGSVPGSTLPKCWITTGKSISKSAAGNWTVSYSVSEKSTNAFLGVLDNGLRYQTFNLTSRATVNQNTE